MSYYHRSISQNQEEIKALTGKAILEEALMDFGQKKKKIFTSFKEVAQSRGGKTQKTKKKNKHQLNKPKICLSPWKIKALGHNRTYSFLHLITTSWIFSPDTTLFIKSSPSSHPSSLWPHTAALRCFSYAYTILVGTQRQAAHRKRLG